LLKLQLIWKTFNKEGVNITNDKNMISQEIGLCSIRQPAFILQHRQFLKLWKKCTVSFYF